MQHCSFCVLWRALFGVGNVHNLWTMCHAWRAKCKQRGKRNTVKFVPPGHTFTDSASQTVSLKDTQCVNVHHTNKFCPISTLYLSCVWGWFDRKLETFKLRKGFFLTTSIFIIVSDTQAKIFNFSTIICWPSHWPDYGIVMAWKEGIVNWAGIDLRESAEKGTHFNLHHFHV